MCLILYRSITPNTLKGVKSAVKIHNRNFHVADYKIHIAGQFPCGKSLSKICSNSVLCGLTLTLSVERASSVRNWQVTLNVNFFFISYFSKPCPSLACRWFVCVIDWPYRGNITLLMHYPHCIFKILSSGGVGKFKCLLEETSIRLYGD